MTLAEKKEIRRMVADLICSAGCDCCRNTRIWEKAQAELAKKLGVSRYKDGSGFNFTKFESKP